MTISDSAIAGAAKAAGFRGKDIATAVAIALAESSGNPRAYNGKGLDRSYGLMQINMIGSLGPARRKRYGLSSNSELFDPVTNMKAAYGISNQGSNWTPWTTYTSGRYRRYLSRANKAAGNPSSDYGSSGATQAGFSDSFGAITDFFEWVSNPKTWLQAGLVVGGGILLAVALFQLSGQGARLKQIASVAADVLPQGKALKAAKVVK